MRTLTLTVTVVALAVGSTACATKKYVNTRVADVNDQVVTLSTTLEETQAATQKNQARIGEVERDVTRAQARADAAGEAAAVARSMASAVGTRVDDMEASSRRLIYEVVLTDDKARFACGRAVLTPNARAEIDRLVQQLQAAPRNVWIEVEGHTDATGPQAFNKELGMARAEAVRQYLHEQHHVPLHKINAVSYGETHPIAPNTTRAGRAMNRRVTVQVIG
jgi:outer membrane protein OmpA-like peptidoglycan-associated protein